MVLQFKERMIIWGLYQNCVVGSVKYFPQNRHRSCERVMWHSGVHYKNLLQNAMLAYEDNQILRMNWKIIKKTKVNLLQEIWSCRPWLIQKANNEYADSRVVTVLVMMDSPSSFLRRKTLWISFNPSIPNRFL